VNQDVLDKSKGGSTRVAFLVGSVSRGQAKRRIYKLAPKAFQSSVFDRYLQRADRRSRVGGGGEERDSAFCSYLFTTAERLSLP
jgi:hypothetical protein